MKTLMTRHLAVIMVAVVAISAGVTYAITGSVATNAALSQTSAFLMGHAEVIVTDSDGYVKAYRQADNAIVADGMNLLVNRTFADINATTQQVNWMHIGNNSAAPAWNDAGLVEPVIGCPREDAAFSSPFAVNSGGFAQIVVNGTATFLGSNCAEQSIDEAGVFTKSSGGAMFARNIFNDVDLEAADELTLKWDFVFTDS